MLWSFLRRPQRSTLHWPTVISGGSRGGARGTQPPPPSFLDQTEARRAEKKFFWDGPPPFSQGLDGRPPPSSPYLKICIRHWLFLKSKLCYALHGLHLSLAAAVIVRDRECNSNGKHFKKTYQTIRKLQNKIIRIITFSKFTDHTSPSALFKELSILYL